MERIQKLIANAGHCSRRAAEELIAAGRVRVNGKKATLGNSAEPTDQILVDGQKLRKPRVRYILLNKPFGYETTLHSSTRKRTVIDLLPHTERLIPCGRLDYDSSGVLLLTNDGEFAHRVMHPRHVIDKVYHVLVAGRVPPEKMERLRRGVRIGSEMSRPCTVRSLKQGSNRTKLAITLHEGRNRQIRRMLAAVGHDVLSLERVRIGSLTLKGLKPGQWRPLSPRELSAMKRTLGMTG